MSQKVRMIDPPSGWIYGFPKPIPSDVTNVKEWLVENGYPKEEIDNMREYFHYRTWEQPSEEIATLKFNGGALALLCHDCSRIVKIGKDFTEEEMAFAKGKIPYLRPRYCDECKK